MFAIYFSIFVLKFKKYNKIRPIIDKNVGSENIVKIRRKSQHSKHWIFRDSILYAEL